MRTAEYKMTMVMRILVSITILPLGLVLLAAGVSGTGSRHQSDLVLAAFGLLLVLGALIVWVHHSRKRFIVAGGKIERRSIFGDASVSLNSQTSITSRTVQANVAGPAGVHSGALGAAAAGLLLTVAKNRSEEKTAHIDITVSDGAATIALTSNVKDVARLRDDLAEFEMAMIFPHLAELYRSGKKIGFGRVTLQNGEIIAGSKRLPVRSVAEMAVKEGVLVVKEKGKRRPFLKVPATKVVNINALIALVTGAGAWAESRQPAAGSAE